MSALVNPSEELYKQCLILLYLPYSCCLKYSFELWLLFEVGAVVELLERLDTGGARVLVYCMESTSSKPIDNLCVQSVLQLHVLCH